jgi:hypothetical protein
VKPATTITTGLQLANPLANLGKLLTAQRTAITDAQGKLAPLVKRRAELEAKCDELLPLTSARPDALDGAAVESHAAGQRQLALIESSILALDAEIEAAESAVRGELGKAVNNVIRPTLGAEHGTVLKEVVTGIRQFCHDDLEAGNFARQLPVIGDYELWCGMTWVGTAPLEEATQRVLSILAQLAAGQNPFVFNSGLP